MRTVKTDQPWRMPRLICLAWAQSPNCWICHVVAQILYLIDFIPINQETNIPQLTRTLQDVFMAGIICHVELAPWFLSRLVEKLKSVVAGLPSLVPDDFYLPSPPLFCPQPGEIEMVSDTDPPGHVPFLTGPGIYA